ncbi:hypothetical protein [Cellulomonas fimi]|uniref:Uncharacterized protein n=1 Tax=Cellulomonas fimi (strain ATCC 484 / DSM 20113 / JCM 1341 / CCUG 24087 / LMG 16345 / NBRC 15513 / NCIMB 8980 / NCTC 7547 / NRS-133) TaxID=590998 RepID=F4H6A0_CELFA|nr:hypothetical protein [Cellulomonas fimi]AEE44412.1 hypothetical protein Celf_0267 [Cellulomonas fimi ATCC 484]NNH08303.1 hypothetical protein [Cellulomonas fimi]VEH26310.1 Uncharacterised protein [Cellulomonas fimi]
MADLSQARAAKERLRADLAGRPEVRGIGIAPDGDGYQVQVNVSRRTAATLPRAVDGVNVRVRVVGAVSARA